MHAPYFRADPVSDVPIEQDPIFGVEVPTACPEAPPVVLKPRGTWKNHAAHHAQARKLAGMFVKNFKQFTEEVSAEIRGAGPCLTEE